MQWLNSALVISMWHTPVIRSENMNTTTKITRTIGIIRKTANTKTKYFDWFRSRTTIFSVVNVYYSLFIIKIKIKNPDHITLW
jgi:hypothetical protein